MGNVRIRWSAAGKGAAVVVAGLLALQLVPVAALGSKLSVPLMAVPGELPDPRMITPGEPEGVPVGAFTWNAQAVYSEACPLAVVNIEAVPKRWL